MDNTPCPLDHHLRYHCQTHRVQGDVGLAHYSWVYQLALAYFRLRIPFQDQLPFHPLEVHRPAAHPREVHHLAAHPREVHPLEGKAAETMGERAGLLKAYISLVEG